MQSPSVAALPNRAGKGFFGSPAKDFDSLPYPVCGNAAGFGPLGDGVGAPVVRDEVVVGLVAPLLLATRPPAILGAVRTVIVDAFDCAAGRPLAHVRNKVGEGVLPAVAHFDPAPTIAWGAGIRASSAHGFPYVVDGVAGSAMSLVGPREIPAPTPATLGVPAGEVAGRFDDLVPAGAQTAPSNGGSAANQDVRSLVDHGQAPELLTGHIDELGHGDDSITFARGITYTVA